MDKQLLLSAGIIAFLSAILVSGIRAFVPKIDGKAIVALCVVLVGVGLSFLLGGLNWRDTIIRGIIAGIAAFSACSAWQWGTSKLPLSPDNLAKVIESTTKAQKAMIEEMKVAEQTEPPATEEPEAETEDKPEDEPEPEAKPKTDEEGAAAAVTSTMGTSL